MIIKPRKEHRDSIRGMLDCAFNSSRYESKLIDILISEDLDIFEWISLEDGVVEAYICYTPATNDSERIGYHLAPVAVHPDLQGRGVGSRLIRETLQMAGLRDESIFVLGDPLFYERFGFTQLGSARCPFDEDNNHFRALRWQDNVKPFSIGYSPAFQLVEQEDAPKH